MAVKDWRRSREQMQREAIAALADLLVAEEEALATPEAATLAIIAAHQVPELVEMGAFAAGDFDDEALAAMAVVVDIAANWEDEAEPIAGFVAGLDEHDLRRLGRAARVWAAAVWAQMVPLSEAEKQTTMDALRQG